MKGRQAMPKLKRQSLELSSMIDYGIDPAGDPITIASVANFLNEIGETMEECFCLNSVIKGYL